MSLEPAMLLAGRYRLDTRLAVGGMGEVWRARDTVLDRAVAVKVLREEYAEDPQLRQRLRSEALHAAALTHPNVAHVYDLDDAGGDTPPYLVLELVDGETLSQLVARRGPLSPAQTWSVLAQTADALAAAHAAGFVHRDVKPANVLVRPDGLVKVSDFGISRALGDQAATQTGMVFATVHYVAPELLAGERATSAADMYGLGVLGYECLTGRRPFTGDTAAVLAAHRDQPPPPLPSTVPPALRETVASLLAKDPKQRPRAHEVAAHATAHTGSDGPLASLAGAATREGAADPVVGLPSPRTATLAVPPMEPPEPFVPLGETPGPLPAGRPRRIRAAVAAAVVIAAAIAGMAVAVVDRSNGHEHASTSTARAAGSGEHTGAPIPVRSATLFHPGGSDADHAEQAPLAVDGNPATAWFTQHYNSAAFGGLRPGVGLLLDLGSPESVRSMNIQLATPGVDLHVYAGSDPAALLDGSPVATADAAPSDVRLTPGKGVTARYWLVWFTRLAPSDGAFRAGVGEIGLRG